MLNTSQVRCASVLRNRSSERVVFVTRNKSLAGLRQTVCKANTNPEGATQTRLRVSDVHEVGLKDVPLKSLYPDELLPPSPNTPRLKVAIIGGGLAALSTAVELLEQGYEVDIYEGRKWIGGKVASYVDKQGNHIEMGLHVFFGCYFNLFRLMAKAGVLENLLLKEQTHTFINTGGDVRELDFRLFFKGRKIGAPFHGVKAFLTTPQLTWKDKLGNVIALARSPLVKALFLPEAAMSDICKLDTVSFREWFLGLGATENSLKRMWDPIAYALGFLDCNDISARCMMTIFQFFATKTDASALRMLNGSPADRLLGPIAAHIKNLGGRIHTRSGCREILYDTVEDNLVSDANGNKVKRLIIRGLRISSKGFAAAAQDGDAAAAVLTPYAPLSPEQNYDHSADSDVAANDASSDDVIVKADAYVAALDVPGIKKLLPSKWCEDVPELRGLRNLKGVPVITVQLRYDGWVTELQDPSRIREVKAPGAGRGIDNLLYSADAFFSCFADLAVTSPVEYFKEGQGSLMQVVITPAKPYMSWTKDEIAKEADRQVRLLFPSAAPLTLQWSSVVKIAQSLYNEAPGMDAFRPGQTPDRDMLPNFFLAGSYTKQDYIDSMEGATLSGRLCAAAVKRAAVSIKESARRLG